MGITKSTVWVGQKPPKEAIREAKRAARKPINYTKGLTNYFGKINLDIDLNKLRDR